MLGARIMFFCFIRHIDSYTEYNQQWNVSWRIDVIQPQIRNLMVYLLPLPDKKLMTGVFKCDKMSAHYLSEKVQ